MLDKGVNMPINEIIQKQLQGINIKHVDVEDVELTKFFRVSTRSGIILYFKFNKGTSALEEVSLKNWPPSLSDVFALNSKGVVSINKRGEFYVKRNIGDRV